MSSVILKKMVIFAHQYNLLMAYVTKKDQIRYMELGSYPVDFNEGDLLLLESVKDISPFFPLDPKSIMCVVCNKGRLTIDVEGCEVCLNEGNVMHCPPKVRVSVKEHSNDFDCKVLCISDHIVRGLLRDQVDVWQHESYICHLNIASLTQQCREEFGVYFSMMRTKLKQNDPTTHYEILLALLRAFLLELHFTLRSNEVRRHEPRMSQGKVLFNRFLFLVSNSEVKRQPISFYAAQLAITPKYLTMLCLKYSNKTASEWVAQYTVEEIRYYLKHTELSIKEISAHLGFSNMSHFGSYVRKHLGVSPSEYRHSRKQ